MQRTVAARCTSSGPALPPQNVDVTSASTLTRSPERQDGGVRRFDKRDRRSRGRVCVRRALAARHHWVAPHSRSGPVSAPVIAGSSSRIAITLAAKMASGTTAAGTALEAKDGDRSRAHIDGKDRSASRRRANFNGVTKQLGKPGPHGPTRSTGGAAVSAR